METFNTKFVNIIAKYRCLYDCAMPEYSHKDITEKAWIQVAKELNNMHNNVPEYNLTVKQYKERWKNLRTAFLRKIKRASTDSGSKITTRYYLEDAMKFLLPFTKVGKLSNSDSLLDAKHDPYVTKQDVLDTKHDLINLTETSKSPELDLQSETDPLQSETDPLQSSSPRPTSPSLENKKCNKSFTGLEKKKNNCEFIPEEHHSAKKAKLNNSDERKEGIQQFLNSLLPDLLLMTDPQVRSFKRRTLVLIDEVMGNTPLEYTAVSVSHSFS